MNDPNKAELEKSEDDDDDEDEEEDEDDAPKKLRISNVANLMCGAKGIIMEKFKEFKPMIHD